jgi:hypothetical protein
MPPHDIGIVRWHGSRRLQLFRPEKLSVDRNDYRTKRHEDRTDCRKALLSLDPPEAAVEERKSRLDHPVGADLGDLPAQLGL